MYTSLFSFDYMKGSFKVFCLATNVLLMVWCFSLNLQLYVTVIPDSYGLHPFGGLLAAYKVGLLLCWFACLWLDYELLICWFLLNYGLLISWFVCVLLDNELLICWFVCALLDELHICWCVCVLLDYELLICWFVVLLDYELLIYWFV